MGSSKVIDKVNKSCEICNSLKQVPKEIFEQSNSSSPASVGSEFAADVIQRKKQHILVVRDILSSYTTSSIIPEETGGTLRTGLLINTASIRMPSCTIRVDNAPGLVTLKDDHLLKANGIILDFGKVKNINKNPVAEKANQELETELLHIDPSGSTVSPLALCMATDILNSRIRHQGLSAKEIVFGRDQFTGAKLEITGDQIAKNQEKSRQLNHPPSSFSKATIKRKALNASVRVGDLVFLKGDKNCARERYIVMNILNETTAILTKMNNSKMMSRKYEVPLTHIFPAIEKTLNSFSPEHCNDFSYDEPSEEEEISNNGTDGEDEISASTPELSDNSNSDEEVLSDDNNPHMQRPLRQRRELAWLRGNEWER